MSKLRVGIVFGGISSEKEVSLNSGRNVYDNLDRDLYEPVPVFMDAEGKCWIIPWQLISQNTTRDISERLQAEAEKIAYEKLREEIDFVFIALHGKYGDDGCIQGLLELLGIPYTGSGVLGSAIGMDKHVQQRILRAAGLLVPESILVSRRDWFETREDAERKILGKFRFPFVTKPVREGSSVGVRIIRDRGGLAAGLEEAFQWDNAALIEEFLDGTEFSSIVLEEEAGPVALNLTEIHPESEFFTYEDKYMPGRCRKFTPPKNFTPEAVAAINKEVLRAFIALDFRCYGRIDGFILRDGRVLITDPNSSSGMAPSSFFFEQAAEAGYLPSMIISRLIEISVRIHGEKAGPL
jgi:D-alanine-D-alanine ligase